MRLVSYWEIVSPVDSQGRWLLHIEQHGPTHKSLPKPPSHFFNPLNPKIKIWILICCVYSFPTEEEGRSW